MTDLGPIGADPALDAAGDPHLAVGARDDLVRIHRLVLVGARGIGGELLPVDAAADPARPVAVGSTDLRQRDFLPGALAGPFVQGPECIAVLGVRGVLLLDDRPQRRLRADRQRPDGAWQGRRRLPALVVPAQHHAAMIDRLADEVDGVAAGQQASARQRRLAGPDLAQRLEGPGARSGREALDGGDRLVRAVVRHHPDVPAHVVLVEVVDAVLLEESRDECEVGLAVLHTIIARCVVLDERETEPIGVDPSSREHVGDDRGGRHVLEHAADQSRRGRAEDRQEGATVEEQLDVDVDRRDHDLEFIRLRDLLLAAKADHRDRDTVDEQHEYRFFGDEARYG